MFLFWQLAVFMKDQCQLSLANTDGVILYFACCDWIYIRNSAVNPFSVHIHVLETSVQQRKEKIIYPSFSLL